MRLCTCQRAYSLRAAQCNGILISILVFPIKPHYMKLLLHASTQITTLVYLRIFPLIYRQCLYVHCTVFCTYSTSIGIFAHTRTVTVYVYRTYSDSSFAHKIYCTSVSVSLLLNYIAIVVYNCTQFRFRIKLGGLI